MNELVEIETIKNAFYLEFQRIILTRDTDIVHEATASNRTYLQNLRTFYAILREGVFEEKFSRFDEIRFIDSTRRPIGINIIKTFLDERKLLEITLGRDGIFYHKNFIDKIFLEQILDITLLKGFSDIYHHHPEDEILKPAINELFEFLTPDMTAFLVENGVTSLELNEYYEDSPELFVNGRLILGLTRESMQRVVNAVF